MTSTVSRTKLTPIQLNDMVQNLHEIVVTGNGEVSLREMFRGLKADYERLYSLMEHNMLIQSEERKKWDGEKISKDLERLEELQLYKKKIQDGNSYWSRTLIVLVLGEVIRISLPYLIK